MLVQFFNLLKEQDMQISPGVYSEIIDKSGYTPEGLTAGFFGLFPIFSRRGEDNKIKLKTNLPNALREYGEPNYNKYGLPYHFADNWLKGGSSAYLCRLLPDDAKFANIVAEIQDRSGDLPQDHPTYKGNFETKTAYALGDIVKHEGAFYSASEVVTDDTEEFEFSSWTPLTIKEMSSGIRGEFSEKESYSAGDYVYRQETEDNNTVISFYRARKSSDPSEFIETRWQKQTNTDTIVFADGDYVVVDGSLYRRTASEAGLALPITAEGIWDVIYYDIKVEDVFGLRLFSSDEMSNKDLIIDDERPHIVFRAIGRGEDYNKLSIVIRENTSLRDTYNFVVYTLSILDKDDNGVSYQIGDDFPFALDPDALDLGGESLFLPDILERYSDIIRATVNTEQLEDVAATAYSQYEENFDIEDIYSKDILSLGGERLVFQFNGGSDGSLLDSMNRIDRSVEKELLIDFFKGTVDPKISNFKDVMSKVIFDANFDKTVIDQFDKFTQSVRPDMFGFITTGASANEEQVLAYRSNQATYDNRCLSIKAGTHEIFDEYSGKYIKVPSLYSLVYNISVSWRVNGVHVPVAGYNTRGNVTGIRDGSLAFNPDKTYQDLFYLNQINPIIKDPSGYFNMGVLTTQRKQSAMSNENIVNMIQVIDIEAGMLCEKFLFDFITPTVLSNLSNQLNDYFVKWTRNDGIEQVSVDVYASELDKKNKTIRVTVEITPTSFIEKILITFVVK